ncbi:hypothetical protein TREMEDRAFT_66076 [Tremella mesenterica DSM 1558]|uniref:uncharacterized protein n=1 Tax=Tremella mesenterica (strain ATCC 24925 / CBS 8224 / DSM 1558 / NBRC 9311 / NRRL Y-6157 / RJB 2259-6 / UBC 559-6) TaxID=578456 RepID=UPI00032BCD5E|nr:uncharacterized protein TREMEDRAFT_66076 [Tremella mesenterica DSM 1558]EIW65986.1 hypothetical protein TREMEDRAFT_66076 [Tremella mesenterica DSM 1558]
MLDVMTTLVGVESAYLLYTSYTGVGMFSEIVRYDTRWIYGEMIRLSSSGKCLFGNQEVLCSETRGVLSGAVDLAPWVGAACQIFYSLTLFFTLVSAYWYTAAYRRWGSTQVLREVRWFVLTVMGFSLLSGFIASSLGLAVLFPPLLNPTMKGLINVQVGSGEIILMLVLLGVGYLSFGFYNVSKEALDILNSEGQVRLEVDDEDTPLLSSYEKEEV